MEYLSVCSGIEAATVAWQPLGWSAYGFSEIERLPSAVLQHHYLDTPNYGDMNDFRQWPKANIDVLVVGTPCQSFSVARLRQGMADPRGNLALVYVALVARYSPTWFVWENVPGVLSSNDGRDFGAFIGAMVKLGYGIAYRVLDAQYFGVPQRRRRVFVVGYLGDWRRATEILFEPSCLRRHPPPSRETGQGAAPDVAKSIRGCSGGIDREDMHTLIVPPITSTPYGDHDSRHEHLIPDVTGPLLAQGNNTGGNRPPGSTVDSTSHLVAHSLRGEGFDASEDGTGRGTPIVVHQRQDSCTSDIAFTHDANSPPANAIAIRTAQTSANGIGVADDVAHTIDGAQGQAVAFAQNQRNEVRLMDKAGALAAEPGAKQQTYVFKQGQGSKAGSIGGAENLSPTLGAAASSPKRTPA